MRNERQTPVLPGTLTTVHEAGRNTIAKLNALGCESHIFQGGISDDARLRKVFAHINGTLPLVKGYIQCCFVLRAGASNFIAHQDWETLASKVSGS